jgi:hypothetical protein
MRIILFVLLFAVLTVSGCLNDDKLINETYEGPDGDTVRFFEDGKMHYTSPKGTGSLGVYTIEEGRVYFNAAFWTWSADIMEGELIDDDGDIYVLVDQ